MITKQQIAEEAAEWEGTPHKFQGRLKGIGCDCAGLLVGISNELNLGIEDNIHYAEPPPGLLEAELNRQMIKIDNDQIDFGDVIAFNFGKGIQHVGIVLSINPVVIIHSYSQTAKAVIRKLDRVWISQKAGVYRFKDLTNV